MMPRRDLPGDKEALRIGDVLRGAGGKRFRVMGFERKDDGGDYLNWYVALAEWNGTEWVNETTVKEEEAERI